MELSPWTVSDGPRARKRPPEAAIEEKTLNALTSARFYLRCSPVRVLVSCRMSAPPCAGLLAEGGCSANNTCPSQSHPLPVPLLAPPPPRSPGGSNLEPRGSRLFGLRGPSSSPRLDAAWNICQIRPWEGFGGPVLSGFWSISDVFILLLLLLEFGLKLNSSRFA